MNRLRFFSTVQAIAEFLIADLQRTTRHMQAVRVWAWQKATMENLRTINDRQTARTRFC